MERAASDARPALSLDRRVVHELAQRRGHLAFNGLRRALEAHPESLTRSLRRLERFGTIGHDDGGYYLVDGPAPDLLGSAAPSWTELASVQLPDSLGAQALVGLLAGRWFGAFRWVGLQEGRGGTSLVWSAAGVPGHLLARWRRGRLLIVAELPKGRAPDATVSAAADELLWQLLTRLRGVLPPMGASSRAEAVGTTAFWIGPTAERATWGS